jgi:ABC-type glycerol-3-phosphate transport system substrate-binding protein
MAGRPAVGAAGARPRESAMGRTSRRKWLGGGGAAFGGVIGAACGAPAEQSAPAGGAAAKQPVTLRLNFRTEKWIPERAKEFTAAFPLVTVDPVANTGYEKLLVLVAAGDMGDLVWDSVGVGAYYQLGSQGQFKQLDALVNRDRFDVKQYYAAAIDTARLDGKLLGLPSSTHPSHLGLFYNVNAFGEAGLRPPATSWTLDDLLDAARRLTRPGERWGFETETAYPPTVVWLRTFGADFLEPGTFGKKPQLDRPAARQALQWLYDLRHRHRVHPVQGVDKATFTDGSVAMRQSLMSNYLNFPRQAGDKFRVEAVLLPRGPGGARGTQRHVGLFEMNAKTERPDETWELHKWMTDKESALRQGRLDSGIPGARPDAWNEPEFAANPMFRVFKDLMDREPIGPVAVPANYRMPEIQTLSDKLLAPLWTGEQAPEPLVASVLGQFQALLDQPKQQ